MSTKTVKNLILMLIVAVNITGSLSTFCMFNQFKKKLVNKNLLRLKRQFSGQKINENLKFSWNKLDRLEKIVLIGLGIGSLLNPLCSTALKIDLAYDYKRAFELSDYYVQANKGLKTEKERWEAVYKNWLDYSGNEDADIKYQEELQEIVQIFIDKGYLRKDTKVYLKLMGQKAIEDLKERNAVIWSNAFADPTEHFIHAHESLLSDELTPEERKARFAHEVGHIIVRQHPVFASMVNHKRREEFVCDLLSTIIPGATAGAVKLFEHSLSRLGDTNGVNKSHPYTSTRIKYFTLINYLQEWYKDSKESGVDTRTGIE